MAPAAVKASLSTRQFEESLQPRKIEMSKAGFLGAIALAAIIGGHGAHAQTPIPPSPKDFVMAASQSDQYEVFAANVAALQGQDPRVRTFAQQMIAEHTRLAEDIRRAAMASGMPPPEPGMSSDQASLLSSLQSVRGADFDKTYARQQELAHAQAIVVDESFAMAGSDPNLRKAAQSALPSIRYHLKMAQQLRVDVGGS
jgi:putative membrane protein